MAFAGCLVSLLLASGPVTQALGAEPEGASEIVRMKLELVPETLLSRLDTCAVERLPDGPHAILVLDETELDALRESGIAFTHLEGRGVASRSARPENTLRRKPVPSLEVGSEPDSSSLRESLGEGVEGEALDAAACAEIGTSLMPYDEYHRFSESTCFIENLAAAFPEIAEVVDLGPSVEGRRITALVIGKRRRSFEVEKILFTGVTHAREWITHEIVLHIAEYLTSNYASDRDVRRLVDRSEVWLVPVVNPDGFDYSWDHRRFYRKNRAFTNQASCRGVDVNRNFSANWGAGTGGSPFACHEIYQGPGPASEPETQAIEDLMQREQFAIAINFHSYGNLLLYPWASREHDIAESDAAFRAIARRYADELQSVHGNQVLPGPFADILYRASGTMVEYAIEAAGTLALTVEARPGTWEEGGFAPAEDQILPAAEENLKAALWLMKNVADARDVRPARHWGRAPQRPGGIETFSLPLVPVNQKPERLYGNESFFRQRLLRWVDDPRHFPARLGAYGRDFHGLASGRGYYVNFTGLPAADTPALRSYKALPYVFDRGAEVALSNRVPGVNVVGVPFDRPLPLADVRVVKRVSCTDFDVAECRYGERVLEERTALEDLGAGDPWLDWRWQTIDRHGQEAFAHPLGSEGASRRLLPFRAYAVDVHVRSGAFGSTTEPVYALRFPAHDGYFGRPPRPDRHFWNVLRHWFARWHRHGAFVRGSWR